MRDRQQRALQTKKLLESEMDKQLDEKRAKASMQRYLSQQRREESRNEYQ